MSDLIHIISWERFCDKNNISDFEKYFELPMQNHPGLLDIRNLNLRNSGPLLEDLPDNCLGIIGDRLESMIEDTGCNDLSGRVIGFIKMFCLIARNGNNLAALEAKKIPALMVKLVDLSLHELSQAMDSGWLTLFEYLMYFLEIIYDPTFSWRRRKKLFYSEYAQLETIKYSITKSSAITTELTTWLCSQLNKYFKDRDIRNRLTHLFCLICSGSKTNAQFIISPATVDAFKFDLDVNIETVVCYCGLICFLAELPISERQEELSNVLIKLFQYITDKSDIRISEMRCLYQLLLVNDELSADLIKYGILTVIRICLSNIDQDQEQCSFCFLLLSQLTSGEYQAKDQFIKYSGYNEILQYLMSNTLQAAFLLDQIFTWAVAKPFDASKIGVHQYIIRDGHVVGLLIRWATSLALLYERESDSTHQGNNKAVVNWKAIFKLIVELSHQNRCSISRCCDSGIITVISDCIQQACLFIDTNTPVVINHDDKDLCERLSTIQRKCDELLKGLFHLMKVFCNYSFAGSDLKAVMRLFKDKYTRTRCKKLITIFINIISDVNGYDKITHWFELSQPGDCISIAPTINTLDGSTSTSNGINSMIDRRNSLQKPLDGINWKIGSYGFSFHCWLNLSHVTVAEKVDKGHERSSLFRLLTGSNNGFEAFINIDGQLIIATCHLGEYNYVQITNNISKKSNFVVEENFLKPEKWNMLDIVFQNAKNFFSKPLVLVYVNKILISSVELKYPISNEEISVFHIGGCPQHVKISNKNLTDLRSKRKSAFIGSSSIKKAILCDEHNTWGRISTLKCRIVAVACLNDVLSENMIGNLYERGPMDTQAIASDENISAHILINFHASAFSLDDKTCFNLHPYIQSSRSNKFHSGILTGEWLQKHKFEDVINEIGGFAAILPIVEQLEFMHLASDNNTDQEEGYHFDENDGINSPTTEERFISVPDQMTEMKWNESVLASIVTLIRKLTSFETNQQQMDRIKFIQILGAMLQKIETILLDMNVVLSFHSLADLSHPNIASQIYQFILLDWQIWSRCNADLRDQHCLFVLNLVKNDRAMFRNDYGILFFLDTIRLYHKPDIINTVDVHKSLREKIYSMIFHLVHKHVTIDDYQRILKFIHECNDDIMIQECLNLLTELYNSAEKTDQGFLLSYEHHLMESLFVLLIKDLSAQTKESAIKFLHLIITSTRTQDKFKNHLLLSEISFAAIFTFKEFCHSPLSAESIHHLLDIIKKAAAKDLFGVIQFLSLLTLSPINQRISAVKMLKSFFDKSPDAILAISKQPGWQDILIHLLVLFKREDKESVSSLTENEKTSENELRRTESTCNDKGFRRSSTWVFDDSNCDNASVTISKFDEVLEEDEDEFSISEQVTDMAEMLDENLELKSIDTMYLRQMASMSNDPFTDDNNSLNMSMSCFSRPSPCIGSADETMFHRKQINGVSYVEEKELLQKELVELVLHCLHQVMWSVLSSSHERDSWMVVHQVLESLQSVEKRYVLLEHVLSFKQKILTSLLSSLINTFRISNNSINQLSMHSKELVYLIVDSYRHSIVQCRYPYDIQLFNLTMDLLQECLQVWDEETTWPEMAALGFSYLLSLSRDPDLEIVSAVCARLHQIITCISKNVNYDEIAFILIHLDRVLKIVINSDNYYFVAPILKTLLESHGDMFYISNYLPGISIKSADFVDEFKDYCDNPEWRSFLESKLFSACEIYESTYLNEMTTAQSLWRAEANEQMSLDRKERWAMSNEHRKQFEIKIISMTKKWIKEERKRKDCMMKDLQMRQDAILRHWRLIKQFLTSSKGCWYDSSSKETMYWKQSCRENYLRMRPRFDPNYQYDQHLDASKERDHPSHSSKDIEPDPLVCLSALEGKIDLAVLGDDQLGDDEWMTVQGIGNDTPTTSTPKHSTIAKRNVIFECRCRLITFTEVIDGKFELTNSRFIFQGNNTSVDSIDINDSLMVNYINQIREIHLRRYNLRRSAIEIFLTDQTNYFFDFSTKIRNKVYSKLLSLKPPNLIYSKQRSPADLLKSSNLTQRWVNREISNFEYLMQLNTIAGRTYNDLSQYPVFPWIIADYTSPTLDLNDPKTFRDLSKPIGVVNPKHESEIHEKYECFEDPNGVVEKFHYGTHYSCAAGVMHYLVRVEPFTTMHIQLQSGKFDVADRQFHSIPMAWSFIMESPNDNKELIPEFFYQPDFLRNHNMFNFGLLQQTKTPIDDVELPAWAKSAEDFIYQHQQALESDHVSQNLHHWIDLIFGYKQKGIEAVKALNVFYYVTYEGVVDLDHINDPCERESIESMINNFGQTPCQLLKQPHPRRMTETEEKILLIRTEKYLPVISNVSSLKHQSKSICSKSEPIVFIRVPPAQTKSIMSGDKSFFMVTVHSSNIMAKHSWMPYYRTTGSTYHIDVDPVFDMGNLRRKAFLGNISSLVESSNQLYEVTPDCKFLLAGGNIENRLTVMCLMKKNETINVRTPHHLPISCVAIDIDSTSPSTASFSGLGSVGTSSMIGFRLYGITGSLDSTCVVWDWSDLPSVSVIQILCGHSAAVTSVSLSVYLDLALSGSADGTVNLHSVIRGQFLHTITPSSLTFDSLSVNFVRFSRMGYIYIQWQNAPKYRSKSTESCSANYPKQFISLYSLHANLISSCEIGNSKVTVVNIVPKTTGSINNCVLVGNMKGELSILDGYYLTDQNTLNFGDQIMDVQMLSSNGQQLGVALSNGCLIISTVSLSYIDK